MINIYKRAFFVMLAITFGLSIVSCSDENESENTNNLPVKAKEIAFVNDKGEIQLKFSQNQFIADFNAVNKGMQLRFVDIHDENPSSISSNAGLVMNAYLLERESYLTFTYGKITKILEDGVIKYYYSNNTNKVGGPGTWVGCEAQKCCSQCNYPEQLLMVGNVLVQR